MASFDLYWLHVGYMGPRKPSSPVTTLSNHPSLLCDGFLVGEWGSPWWWPGQMILGAKTSSWEQGPRFDLVGTLQMWDPRGHAYDMLSGSSLQGVYRFESPWHSWIWVTACPSLSSSSMSGGLLMVTGWAWLWLRYHDDNCIYYTYDVDSLSTFYLFMHVIVCRCNYNTWLN
jgi:hypothetical protein